MNQPNDIYDVDERYRFLINALYVEDESEPVNLLQQGLIFGENLEQVPLSTDKIDNLVKTIRVLEARAAGYEAEVKRMVDAHKALLNRAKWIKDYLKFMLEASGAIAFEGKLFKIALQNSPPSCEVVDPEIVLKAGFAEEVRTVKVDRVSIIKYWKETGQQIAGSIVSAGKHLRIRP
jgi:hypothetical protein